MRLAIILVVLLVQAKEVCADSLSERIDRHLAAAWAAEKVTTAASADDGMFVRRVYLDLIGRIPSIAEVRSFLDDRRADKRARLVAALLESPAYAQHWARFWRHEWLPQADSPRSLLSNELDPWLAARLRAGDSYDRLVRGLITARPGSAVPLTLESASDFKPENLAANTTRAFLGINLDCAQCHDHPFARWTREQFWQTAAFFVSPGEGSEGSSGKLELAIPETKKTVAPVLLTGPQPRWPQVLEKHSGREVLASWVTARDNPYFARNAVNRVWAKFFGIGLVEPLDDLSGTSPCRHHKLLDELAQSFAASGFDQKFLIQSILLTHAYQLSSVAASTEASEPDLFARAPVRGLSPEQLYDSLRLAAGLPLERTDLDPQAAQRNRNRFVEQFRVERPGQAQRSILQALALMNGSLTAEFTAVARTPTLRAVADAPFLDRPQQVEALYLAALGRPPTQAELAPLVKYVEDGGALHDSPRQALADIFWALLNSSEFNTNH